MLPGPEPPAQRSRSHIAPLPSSTALRSLCAGTPLACMPLSIRPHMGGAVCSAPAFPLTALDPACHRSVHTCLQCCETKGIFAAAATSVATPLHAAQRSAHAAQRSAAAAVQPSPQADRGCQPTVGLRSLRTIGPHGAGTAKRGWRSGSCRRCRGHGGRLKRRFRAPAPLPVPCPAQGAGACEAEEAAAAGEQGGGQGGRGVHQRARGGAEPAGRR